MKTSDSRVPIVVTVLALGIVAWLVAGAGDETPQRDETRKAEPVARALRSTPAKGNATPPSSARPAASAQPSASAAAEDAQGHREHAHPITDQHELLAHERRTIQKLNDAMDRGDGLAMRPLLAEYRQFHHDEMRLQAGYEVIADCLQNPGESSRRAAERYYQEERASTLRRFVRRHCFDNEFP